MRYNRDPDLLLRIGDATALEVRATGIPYTFAPCIAVSYNSYPPCHNLKDKFLLDTICLKIYLLLLKNFNEV